MKKVVAALLMIPSLSMAKGLTLSQLIEKAITNNPEIKIARKEEKISQYQYREAIGKFFPSINLEYKKFSHSDAPEMSFSLPPLPPTSFPLLEKHYHDFQATLTQPLFTGGYLFYNAKLKKAAETAQFYKFQDCVAKVIAEVKKDYYTLSEAKTAVKIAEDYVKAAKNHLRDAKAFYDEGIVARRDYLEAEVKYREALEALTKAKSFYTVALEKLKTDTGIQEENIEVDKLSYKPVNYNESELIEKAFQSNPLLMALRKMKEGANYGVKMSYSQFLPKISVIMGYEKTDQYPGIGEFDETFGALVVQIPIFEGTQRYWRTLEAKENSKKVSLTLKQAKDKIKLGIIAAFSQLKSAESRIKTAQTMVEQAKELLRDSKERYKAHVGTSTEVCDAIAYYVKAEGTLNSAIADYNRSLAELEYFTGGLPASQPPIK
ncbi:TolC family protein [Desulfurobacterium indicum]|nr:TolC family protein [Desulfurobacterium indicum]